MAPTLYFILVSFLLFPLSNGFLSRKNPKAELKGSITQPNRFHLSRCTTSLFENSSDDDSEVLPKKKIKAMGTTSYPISSYLLVIITFRSLTQLLTLPSEIPGAFLVPNPSQIPIDVIATAFDLFFVGFGAKQLLEQNGIIGLGGDDENSRETGRTPSLKDLECRVTLNVGREKGTMMEPEWGASGARLLLPINLKFTGEPVKIDFPGEEAMGGRFCYSLDVLDDCVSFIGPQGEVRVSVKAGAWTTLPIDERKADLGECKLRFFLDFPDETSRNDVTLPAGRIFFSGVCFANAGDAPLEVGESLVLGPGNVGILTQGGITVKRNSFLNLYGALGDTNAILGRYKVDNVKIRDEGCSVD